MMALGSALIVLDQEDCEALAVHGEESAPPAGPPPRRPKRPPPRPPTGHRCRPPPLRFRTRLWKPASVAAAGAPPRGR